MVSLGGLILVFVLGGVLFVVWVCVCFVLIVGSVGSVCLLVVWFW